LRRASATPTAVLAWHLARLQGTRARRARRTRHAQIASTPAHCGTRHVHRGTCRHGHGVPSRRRKRARPDNDAPQAHLEDFSIVEGPPRLAHLPSHPDATSRSQLSSLASRHGRTQDGGLKTGRNKPEGGFRHETPHSPLKRDASLATQERRLTRHSRETLHSPLKTSLSTQYQSGSPTFAGEAGRDHFVALHLLNIHTTMGQRLTGSFSSSSSLAVKADAHGVDVVSVRPARTTQNSLCESAVPRHSQPLAHTKVGQRGERTPATRVGGAILTHVSCSPPPASGAFI
jgi:hypothetical protein